jgi:hypothetical protein
MENLHSGELNNLYSSPDIIRHIKSRKKEVDRACGTCGRGEKSTGFWWESLKERDLLEDQSIDGTRMDLREIG